MSGPAGQAGEPQVTVRTTRYTVSALPETDINYRHAAIHVEYLGRNLRDGTEHWVAVNLGAYLHPDGHWVDHKSYSWPDSDSATAAAQAAIHTTPSAITADAVARSKEQQ